ncbi:hypothetical protein KAJ27_16900 [bacterium]|nr:hypothetical protein [bacterium]
MKAKWIILLAGICIIGLYGFFLDPVIIHWDGGMIDGKMTGGAEVDYQSTLTMVLIHSSIWLMIWGVITGIISGISVSKAKKDHQDD